MIKKLRIKLVAVSMISLMAVLFSIMGTVNYLNYTSVIDKSDDILSILADNNGRFPSSGLDYFFGGIFGDGNISAEIPYESRFFSVVMVENMSGKKILSIDTAHIAAIDAQTAGEYAIQALTSNNIEGFVNNYRYLIRVHETYTRVIFLDCTRDLATFESFFTLSVAISAIGLISVFILIFFLSGRIVRPVSESYEKQKRFITDAGHELKTPLTIIDADAEILEMELGEENEWLKDIKSQTKRLASLTGDLIYLSRMEEENMKLQTIDFPLSDITAETANSFQGLAISKNKTIACNIEPMITINGDEKAIRQLISVLLDNAVKYSSEESVISLTLQSQGKYVILNVSNMTNGISNDDISHLFDRFYRADSSRNSSTGGHGIGLSIAKAVVNAHKGKISAFSPDGKLLSISVMLHLANQ